MKTTAQTSIERLKSRSELPGNYHSARARARQSPTTQLILGGLFDAQNRRLKLRWPFRLRAGDFVLFNNRICPVICVNDCAAVIAVAQRSREFTTIFGETVSLRPKPRFVRISPNSEIPILNRRKR